MCIFFHGGGYYHFHSSLKPDDFIAFVYVSNVNVWSHLVSSLSNETYHAWNVISGMECHIGHGMSTFLEKYEYVNVCFHSCLHVKVYSFRRQFETFDQV